MKLPGKTRLVVVVVGVVAVMFAAGSLPWPEFATPARTGVVHADGGCSVASLSGAYAVSRQGTLVASILGLPAPAPWAEVARGEFDGAGNLTGKVNVNIGGTAMSGEVTGNYTVNGDCTGSITVHPVGVPITVTEAIVVIGGGREYIATDTDSFSVVQGRGERLGD